VAQLEMESVGKAFGAHHAVSEVTLSIAAGEFIAILGPSGCGKTTLLRLVAGFEEVSAGRISIGGRVVSGKGVHLPPEHRKVGIVFQSYALWPHMTVAENVGYGLKVAGVPAAERRRRVDDALALVGLAGAGARSPGVLSGGQRQRVALARCLVTEPSLILLDEPLANLDVHLRATMEDEFAKFHERTGTTMFYITHDQAEAMRLADRIAVMDRGRLIQVARPETLYREPANEIVAGFIGDGAIVPAEILGSADSGRCRVSVLGSIAEVRCRATGVVPAAGRICLRPHDLALAPPGGTGIPGRVVRSIYRGGYFRTEIQAAADPEQSFVLHAADGSRLAEGELVAVNIVGGWAIPGAPVSAADPMAA
jgi:iron(III) transport system ATP-binding protein